MAEERRVLAEELLWLIASGRGRVLTLFSKGLTPHRPPMTQGSFHTHTEFDEFNNSHNKYRKRGYVKLGGG